MADVAVVNASPLIFLSQGIWQVDLAESFRKVPLVASLDALELMLEVRDPFRRQRAVRSFSPLPSRMSDTLIASTCTNSNGGLAAAASCKATDRDGLDLPTVHGRRRHLQSPHRTGVTAP